MIPKRTRGRYTAEFKAEVALAALTERQPLAELVTYYQLVVAQITRCKLQLRQQAAQGFAKTSAPGAALAGVEPLYAAIGRLQMENALLKKCWSHGGSSATYRGRPGRAWQLSAGPGSGAQ